VIELSQRELQRVKVIENAVAGHITVAEAAALLKISERQVQRLRSRCEPGQVDWVRQGNVGQKRTWGLSEGVRSAVLTLARDKYAGLTIRI